MKFLAKLLVAITAIGILFAVTGCPKDYTPKQGAGQVQPAPPSGGTQQPGTPGQPAGGTTEEEEDLLGED